MGEAAEQSEREGQKDGSCYRLDMNFSVSSFCLSSGLQCLICNTSGPLLFGYPYRPSLQELSLRSFPFSPFPSRQCILSSILLTVHLFNPCYHTWRYSAHGRESIHTPSRTTSVPTVLAPTYITNRYSSPLPSPQSLRFAAGRSSPISPSSSSTLLF
jgi:hypothetical protein